MLKKATVQLVVLWSDSLTCSRHPFAHGHVYLVHELAQKDVGTFQVPMNYVQRVTVCHAFTDLLRLLASNFLCSGNPTGSREKTQCQGVSTISSTAMMHTLSSFQFHAAESWSSSSRTFHSCLSLSGQSEMKQCHFVILVTF